MGVDARLAPKATPISNGKSSKSSHVTLLFSKSITSVVLVAEFLGYPVDINILVAVEKVIDKIPFTFTYQTWRSLLFKDNIFTGQIN